MDGVRVGIDHLTASAGIQHFLPLAALLEKHFGRPRVEGHGFYSYRKRLEFGSGAAYLLFTGADDGSSFERDDLCVELKGSRLSELSPDELLELLAGLHLHDPKPTRIDVRADDYGRRILPGQILERCVRVGRFGPMRDLVGDHFSSTGWRGSRDDTPWVARLWADAGDLRQGDRVGGGVEVRAV